MSRIQRILNFQDGKPTGVVEFAGDNQLGLLRVADPILTKLAQGYSNQRIVADKIFPTVPSEKETGRFPAFGQEAFKIYDTKRPLRGLVKKMEVVQGNVLISLDEHSLGFLLDDREGQEFALGADALRAIRAGMVSDALNLERDYNAAVLCTTSGNFGSGNKATGAGWNNWGAGTDNPVSQILIARDKVRQATGRFPNVGIFDPTAWRLFRQNTIVRTMVQYTAGVGVGASGTAGAPAGGPGTGMIITEQMAAYLLELEEVYVARSIYGYGPGGGVGEAALTVADTWSTVQSGNFFMCYRGKPELMEPAFGYSFMKKDYPQVAAYRMDSNESDAYDEKRIYTDAVTLATAGFLGYSIT